MSIAAKFFTAGNMKHMKKVAHRKAVSHFKKSIIRTAGTWRPGRLRGRAMTRYNTATVACSMSTVFQDLVYHLIKYFGKRQPTCSLFIVAFYCYNSILFNLLFAAIKTSGNVSREVRPATIVMITAPPLSKLDRIRSYSAGEINQSGNP